MKNSFNALSLVLAAWLPVAFIMELAGARLPAIVDSTHLFGAFILTFTLKIAIMDYSRPVLPPLAKAPAPVARASHSAPKLALRLAA